MRILIADDDAISRRVLQAMLTRWEYEVQMVSDGAEAMKVFEAPNPPNLAVLDWEMPRLTGLQVCLRVRELKLAMRPYLLMLTSRGEKEDIVTGLDAGADDYLVKPVGHAELRARLRVGERMLELQSELVARVRQLEVANANVRMLQGLLPICSYCKKVRDDGNYWQQVETYIMQRSEAQFSHGICPDCLESVVKPELNKLKRTTQVVGAKGA